MPKTLTHNAILLRPPPGSRFSIFGSDVELQFERGKEREMLVWLQWWLDTYVKPEIENALRGPVDPNPEITALKKRIEEDQAKLAAMKNPGITQNEQKMAAIGLQPTPAAPNVPMYQPPAPISGVNAVNAGVVYGPNGPMSAAEINNLTDKPIPGIGYRSPVDTQNMQNTTIPSADESKVST